MNWQTFKGILTANPELDLQFEYDNNKWVDAAYHITEVKQAPITSVDCGGVTNSWTEVIVQLWEPEGKQQLKPMKVHKALSIFNVVEKALPLNPDGIVKIEFGNTGFATRQMLPGSMETSGDDLIVRLAGDTVQCKANQRGENCGPVTPKDETAACCTPNGGCC